jgi:hypothetical protein
MRLFTWLIGGVLAAAASAAGAQPVPQSHEQHQATGQHQDSASGEKCCCEEMMRKMMMEMMQKHQGKSMGMEMPKDAPPADKEPAH